MIQHGAVGGRFPEMDPSRLVVLASGLAALVFGLALPVSSWHAVAVLVLIPLGLFAPASAVVAILAITVLVPWDLQDHFKVIGGPGHRGVLFVDALLVLALLRTGWLLIRQRIEFDRPMMLGAVVAGLLALATVWGMVRGGDLSAAGNEGRRVIFGAGTFLLAWPLMREPGPRRVLAGSLVGIGLALGIWGLAQWLFDIGYSTTGDVGIRGGLSSGQLQGGMYAYPVAVTLAWAGLVTDAARSRAAKALLAVVLVLNIACVFLTVERTLMISTVLACGFVAANAGAEARRRSLRWISVMSVPLVFGGVLAEAQARTAIERITLLGNVNNDRSYTHRMIEADVIQQQILAHPIFGSGFGASVTWGVDDEFATSTTTFADLGYHWLAWKAGIPVAALIVSALLWAVFRRQRGRDTEQWRAMRVGSRGALLALLLTTILFGVFNALGITAVIGLLTAVCYSGATASDLRAAAVERGRQFPHDLAAMEDAR